MIALVFALTLATDQPTTVGPVTATAPPREKKKPGPDDMVCKTVNRPQSRFTDRVCATRQEWDQRELQDKLELLRQRQLGPPR